MSGHRAGAGRRPPGRAGRGLLAVLTGLLGGALVLFPPAHAAPTPAGTVIPNAGTAGYLTGGVPFSSLSNTTAATVDAVPGVAIAPPRSGTVVPGGSVSYVHTVANGGNAADRFDLSGSTTLGLAVAFYAADNVTPLADTDGNGSPDTGPVPAGGSVAVVVRLIAPAGVPVGASDVATVRAASAADPAVSAAVADDTGIASFWDPLVKTVDPPGTVVPGTTVTYTNTFGNAGSAPATNVVIVDALEPNLLYVPDSATTPAGIPGARVDYDNVARTVTWTMPQVPPGYVGRVSFRATVDPSTPDDAAVTNRIALTSNETPAPEASNVVSTAVVSQPLRITIVADRPAAEVGESVLYTVRVENVSATLPADNAAVLGALPLGFRYVPGSAMRGGVPLPDPLPGTRLGFPLGPIPPGGRVTLTYRALLSVDAPRGDGVNAVLASAASPGGNALAAGPARARVLVREGILNDKAIVLGRVFVDRDGDLLPGDDDPGVPGVRVWLEDGTFAVTDAQGRYAIPGIAPGEHVLKLDRATLPAGHEPVPLSAAFAGDGGSQFVSVPFGGPARGDFGLSAPPAAAAETPAPAAAKKRSMTFSADTAPPAPLEVRVQSMPNTAAILEPADGAFLKKRWTTVVVRVPDGTEHAVTVNGDRIPKNRIGKTIRESARRIAVYEYVGVPLDPGENRIVLTSVGPEGAPATLAAVVTAPGPPDRIVLDPPRATVPADGKTPARLTVTLLDRHDRVSDQEAVLTVVSSVGTVAGEDIDPAAPGHQVRATEGKARFEIVARRPGSDRVRVSAGTGLEAESDVFFTGEIRDWIVAGVGTGTAGVRSASGDTSRVSDPDDLEDGAYADGRLAVFAKGPVAGDILVTGALDTGKPKSEPFFRTTGPDRYYPVYGDNAALGYEAESARKVFLMAERGRSSVLFGDYRTDLVATEFTRYDRTFNGLKADIDEGAFTLRAFGAETAQVVVKDEIPGNGTSGYYLLSRVPVIENSERVRIEVRDRYRSEIVLASVPKTPYADYALDPDAGTLLFKEPVPSLDPDLNPVTIVVVYETEGEGDDLTAGGRAGVRLGRAQAGVTAIVEDRGAERNTLYGADASVDLTGRLRLFGEVASSDTAAAGTGTAWKVELAGDAAPGLKVGAYVRDVDATFVNPTMPGSETGTTKVGARAAYAPGGPAEAGVEGFVQENDAAGTTLTRVDAGGKVRLGRATLEGGYRFVDQEGGAPGTDGTSHMLLAGARGPLAPGVEGTLRHEQSLSGEPVPGYPTRSEAGLSWRLAENLSARMTQEIQWDGEKRHATVMGVESRVTETTTLSTRYAVEDTASGERAQASIGLNNRWQPRQGLLVNTRFERVQYLDADDGPTGTALALSGEYTGADDYKAGGRYEVRFGDGETSNLLALGAVVRLSGEVAFLPKLSLWTRDADGGDERKYDGLVGLSWRPKGTPSVALLDTLRVRYERAGSGGAALERGVLVTSTEATWRPSRRWTLLGKYAGKFVREEAGGASFSFYTDLLLAGATFDVTDRWEVGAQAKLMSQYDAGSRSLGGLVRTGYRVYKNLFAGAGYSLSRLDDRDLSGSEYKAHGPFVEVRFKFDEETFGLRPRRPAIGGTGAPAAQTTGAPAPAAPVPPAPPPVSAAPSPAPPAAPAAPSPAALPPAAPAPQAPPPLPERRFRVSGMVSEESLFVVGSADSFDLLVNGSRLALPSADVAPPGDDLEAVEGRLTAPARFAVTATAPGGVASWRLVIRDAAGRPVRVVAGTGAPPPEIAWDGFTDAGPAAAAPEGYDVQVEAIGADGTLFASPRRAFGLNETNRVVLNVTAGGFGAGSVALPRETKAVLREAARVLREYPEDPVTIEGHGDAGGPEDRNVALSLRRAEAAAAFLAREEGIAPERIAVRGIGSSRPAEPNGTSAGRRANRRVEIRGDFRETRRAPVLDQYRTAPSARIDGAPADVGPDGRFRATLPPGADRIAVDLVSPRGAAVRAAVPVPRAEVAVPDGTVGLPADPSGTIARVRLSGRTDPGNEVEVGGNTVAAGPDGSFGAEVDVRPGENVVGLVVRNASGCARVFQVSVHVVPAEAGDDVPAPPPVAEALPR